MTLPINTTTLTAAAANQVPNMVIASALNIAALQTLFDNASEMYTYVQTFAGPGAIGTVNLADLSVTTGKLALLAVTAAQIALATITAAQLANGAVTNPKVAAGIDAVKIGNADVTNTILSYLNTLTSNAQTQLNNKQPLDSTLTALAIFNTNGLLKQTSADTFTAVTAPTGAVVGTTDTQTLTNKSISGDQVNSGTVPVARMPTGIPAPNIGNGDVTNAILSYLNTLTSNAQTQLNAKAPLTHVGAGGVTEHPDATTSQSGFISVADLIAFRALQATTGLSAYSIPVAQVFPWWSRYSHEQDPITGEWVIYEI